MNSILNWRFFVCLFVLVFFFCFFFQSGIPLHIITPLHVIDYTKKSELLRSITEQTHGNMESIFEFEHVKFLSPGRQPKVNIWPGQWFLPDVQTNRLN